MTQQPLTQQSREYDVVVYGATGFVGVLTAEYLAAHAPAGLRIALAGRNLEKLTATRTQLGEAASAWPLLVADSFDPDALAAIAQSTNVIITTVGPYWRYGRTLAQECARAGTHYVDLSGEVGFMRRSIDDNHERAQATGAMIVHACGFDSVPSELGMYLARQAADEAGAGEFTDATMIVKMKGGLSGGTIDSMRQQLAMAKKDRAMARTIAQPYSLSPDLSKEPNLGRQTDLGTIALDQFGIAGGVAGPFIMAGTNTRVVRRTNALTGYRYGSALRYSEYAYMGKGFAGKRNNFVTSAGLAALAWALQKPQWRRQLSRWIPEPGQGPSKEERDNGFFHTTTYARTADGQQFQGVTSLKADPGYKGTALMLSEAALTLALGEHEQVGGGVWTPAYALGAGYVARLRAAGMKLEAQ